MTNPQNQLIFPLQDIDTIVAWHNVVGPSGVLPAVAPAVAKMVGDHYAARAADHIPHAPGISHYLLAKDADGLQSQAAYRGRLTQAAIAPLANLKLLVDNGTKNALFVPYIRLQDTPLPQTIKWRRYGLPPEVTIRLKDKVFLHTWLITRGYADRVLNFVVSRIPDIKNTAVWMLEKIEAFYADFGMRGIYPMGLMVRGAQSDGNYGSGVVMEVLEDSLIGGLPVKRGQVVVKRDGSTRQLVVFDDWEPAIEHLQQHIEQSTDVFMDNRVIITRLLDLHISPGMCGVVIGGDLTCLPFNGQHVAAGDTACTGTCTFRAQVGPDVAEELSEKYLSQSQELLAEILDSFMEKRKDRVETYAMLNLDIMIPGGHEAELFKRAQQDKKLHHWLDNTGRFDEKYAPRIYDPGHALLTEINPRDTNWTLAMKATLQANQRPPTLQNLAGLADGSAMQVLAMDHWPLPAGVSIEAARDRLLEYHHQLSREGEGIIMRMADNPAGVIMYTPSDDSGRLHQLSDSAFAFLSGSTH